jgi:hypothetical protein
MLYTNYYLYVSILFVLCNYVYVHILVCARGVGVKLTSVVGYCLQLLAVVRRLFGLLLLLGSLYRIWLRQYLMGLWEREFLLLKLSFNLYFSVSGVLKRSKARNLMVGSI